MPLARRRCQFQRSPGYGILQQLFDHGLQCGSVSGHHHADDLNDQRRVDIFDSSSDGHSSAVRRIVEDGTNPAIWDAFGASIVTGAINTVFVSSDFTTTSASLVAITGLNWTLTGSTAANYAFTCNISYKEATGRTATAFGVQDVTSAPTDLSGFSGHQRQHGESKFHHRNLDNRQHLTDSDANRYGKSPRADHGSD